MRLIFAVLAMLLVGVTSVFALEAEPITKSYPLTPEDRQTLSRIEKYLSSITTVAADFIQTSPGGDVSQGKFFLERPGKLRMEYKPPMPILMVANNGDIIYYDKELDQVTHIPMGDTLVGFLARAQVKFDETVVITDFSHAEKVLRITLVQAKRPRDGSLALEFTDYPLVLRNMIVSDAAGQKTIVALNNARFGSVLDKGLFTFKDPHMGSHGGRPIMH
jgi:outer membrane lipoprotein-sorting protein